MSLDLLVDGFDAQVRANQIFGRWDSIFPTDQIMAVEYKPTNLLVL